MKKRIVQVGLALVLVIVSAMPSFAMQKMTDVEMNAVRGGSWEFGKYCATETCSKEGYENINCQWDPDVQGGICKSVTMLQHYICTGSAYGAACNLTLDPAQACAQLEVFTKHNGNCECNEGDLTYADGIDKSYASNCINSQGWTSLPDTFSRHRAIG